MTAPRFTILQLLAITAGCGLLFAVATIDPAGCAFALAVFCGTLMLTLVVFALTYLCARVVAEVASAVVGRGSVGNTPFRSDEPVAPLEVADVSPAAGSPGSEERSS